MGGRRDIEAGVREVLKPLESWGANNHTYDASFGTDNFDFMLEGVPTLVANQEETNYLINYHASSDTFDKVDLPQLKKHVAEAATVVFAIANASERLGPRLNRAQIEQALRENHLDEQLKIFGIWKEWQSGKRGRKQ